MNPEGENNFISRDNQENQGQEERNKTGGEDSRKGKEDNERKQQIEGAISLENRGEENRTDGESGQSEGDQNAEIEKQFTEAAISFEGFPEEEAKKAEEEAQAKESSEKLSKEDFERGAIVLEDIQEESKGEQELIFESPQVELGERKSKWQFLKDLFFELDKRVFQTFDRLGGIKKEYFDPLISLGKDMLFWSWDWFKKNVWEKFKKAWSSWLKS